MFKTAKYTKILCLLCVIGLACGTNSPSDTQLTEKPTADPPAVDAPTQQPRSIPAAKPKTYEQYRSGAEILVSERLNLLEGQSVAIIANHTTTVFGGKHLVDTLLGAGIKVVQVFAPEHGFRGAADAGEKIENSTDPETGLPIISLYGKNRKPTPEQLAKVDLVIFDIQDVGSRHYTYISTMTYALEACGEAGKDFLVLDRANPNGWYVDGPVMQACCTSFIGMHEVPIVHGMTIGEYARMVNEEGWLAGNVKAELEIIPCQGYDHQRRWEDLGPEWNPPSPNLGTEYAAYLYPAICWFEPTPVSVGRGTDDAFTILGAPWFSPPAATARLNPAGDLSLEVYEFTPRSLPGKSKYPKWQDKTCQGYRFAGRTQGKELMLKGLELLATFYGQYQQSGETEPFFRKGFQRWPGSNRLQQQVEAGESPENIWASWQEDVSAFKVVRQKYLLYQDFE
jgi:uncharacterized protein YbbC (DUF1343 family)